MAFFELTSDVTIGKFRFRGVNEVIIKRSIHSIVETAVIKIPSKARILSNNKATPEELITSKQFADGDKVVIKLGYNGELQTEFVGFIKRRNLNMPLEIECEGYSWLMRRNSINIFEKSVTVNELLKIAVEKLEQDHKITIRCEVDFSLSNVLIENKSGFDIINYISKCTDGTLTCFFIQPDVLWCGFAYTFCAEDNDIFGLGKVDYMLGYNTIRENSLKEHVPDNSPIKVQYNKKKNTGDKISQRSDVFKKATGIRSKSLNQLAENIFFKKAANEKAYQLNYSGYEGNITAFLQPYVAPGYNVFIADARYKERDGIYMSESTEVTFGVSGARRKIEIGPKMGFAKDL